MATRLGKYEVLDTLGSGGMGVVYRAHDPDLDRKVAIKVVKEYATADPELKSRFLREARIVASLTHPHIVTTLELLVHDGAPCIVMEHLAGPSLDAQIRDRVAYSLHHKVQCARQICLGLTYAHARGVVHRDVKPANVRFTEVVGRAPSGGTAASTADVFSARPAIDGRKGRR